MSEHPCARLGRGLLASLLLLVPLAPAQDAQSLFHQAYYLENETGQLEQALELYRKVAASESPLRAQAEERAEGIAEELAASEFSRLVPQDTILFVQMDRPGEQVGKLLDQLGLLGTAHAAADRFAVSPLLLENLLGLRGAAAAVTGMDQGGEPTGVVLLHPGRHEGLRGLIETLLPAGGTPVAPIAGFPVWSIEDEAFVCLTRRLVIAGRDPQQIEGIVARLGGQGAGSLSEDARFARTFEGGSGLLSFYVNAQPLVPMISAMVQEKAAGDPGLAMAMNLLDIPSLESLSGRFGVSDEGLGFDLALQLSEGHRNLVFNLMRRPTVGRDTLALVPEGAAFFLATAFNPKSSVAPIEVNDENQPVVTALDFGRELFSNVVDVALYGMPSKPSSGEPLPEAALVLRVNDAARSQALWDLLLGLATQAQGAEPAEERIAGADATRFSIQGMPVYMATKEHLLVIATRRSAIERALGGQRQSAAGDAIFAQALDVLDSSPTFLIAACAGRVCEMAAPFISPDEAGKAQLFAQLLGKTSLTLSALHSSTRLALVARVRNVPDVSELVTQAIHQHRDAHHSDRVEVVYSQARSLPVEANGAPDEIADWDKELQRAVLAGDRDGAIRAGAAMGDHKALNNAAWTLLTEDRFRGEYDDVALSLSRRSNELSNFENWYYLDTLALAEFRAGNAARAVELQSKAIELASVEGEHPELHESLDLYTEGVKGGTSRVYR